VTDHLGTPRTVLDQTGSLTNATRHDYLPFGEELTIGVRATSLGYSIGDGVRQQFTSKERDVETGLDYFEARYYSPTQGRFISVDPIFFQKEMLIDPQRYNHYAYVRNNPLKYVDPKGEAIELMGDEAHRNEILEQLQKAVGAKAGSLLYINQVTDKSGKVRYFVGVKGTIEDFGKINGLAAGIGAIIRDQRVAKVSMAAEGETVSGYKPNEKVVITVGDEFRIDPRPRWTSPTPGWTFVSEYGETSTFFLDANAKQPHIPGWLMENNQGAWDVAASDVLAHELGEVAANWGLIVGDSNHISVWFENEARRLRNPNAKLRTGHSQFADAVPGNWKLGIKIP
jgi:RHS repeat-associated protein